MRKVLDSFWLTVHGVVFRFRSVYKDVDTKMTTAYRDGVMQCLGVKPAHFNVMSPARGAQICPHEPLRPQCLPPKMPSAQPPEMDALARLSVCLNYSM